jgi:hypothetical protein
MDKERRLDMVGFIKRNSARLVIAVLAAGAISAVAAGAASAEVVYNNIPGSLPGNFASLGLAATSTTEFGGEVELAGTARKSPTVTVVMSSWACQSGEWTTDKCLTSKPAKGFRVPLTVRVYAAAELGEGPIAEKTKNVKMFYRPSSSAKCAGGTTWYDETTHECSNGYAFPISIKLGNLKKMPKKAVVTFSYPHASGPATSLNVSLSEPAEHTLSVGTDPVEEWFANSTNGEMYCPGATDVGTLGPEQGVGCQGENYQPVIAVSAEA